MEEKGRGRGAQHLEKISFFEVILEISLLSSWTKLRVSWAYKVGFWFLKMHDEVETEGYAMRYWAYTNSFSWYHFFLIIPRSGKSKQSKFFDHHERISFFEVILAISLSRNLTKLWVSWEYRAKFLFNKLHDEVETEGYAMPCWAYTNSSSRYHFFKKLFKGAENQSDQIFWST